MLNYANLPMATLARVVFPGYPHHITHGGNLCQCVLKKKSPDQNQGHDGN